MPNDNSQNSVKQTITVVDENKEQKVELIISSKQLFKTVVNNNEEQSITHTHNNENSLQQTTTVVLDKMEPLSQQLSNIATTTERQCQEEEEEILKENPNRFVLLPIKYKEVWAMYKKHEASFWTAEEIKLDDDKQQWKELSEDERHFIKHVLAFFAASDGIVIENLVQQFMCEVQIPEVRAFYAFQAMMENIHSETYALLIDCFIQDQVEKKKLFGAIHHFDAIKQKAEWALQWINPNNSFATRLVAFACVEGIFFSGSFCAIYWLKVRGKHLPGLTFSNELISRDEGLHTDFACLLYDMLTKTRLPEETVEKIFRDAVRVEKLFVCEALPVSLLGMNRESMSEYIEYVADRLLVCLGYKKLWNTVNPFPFMEMIALQGKTNFFEKRVGEYQKSGVMESISNCSYENAAFTTEEDF